MLTVYPSLLTLALSQAKSFAVLLQYSRHSTCINSTVHADLRQPQTPVDSASGVFRQRIREEFVQGSAIDPALFDAAIALVDEEEYGPGNEVIATPIHDALNWTYTRFTHQARNSNEAALFKQEDGAIWQAKLKNTVRGGRGYMAPTGAGNRAYQPPVPTVIRERIAARYRVDVPLDGSFWEWLEKHPEVPITVTEGAKKALALLSLGHASIALYGKDCGVSKYVKIGGVRHLKDQAELNPSLAQFVAEGRRFTIAFDQDDTQEKRDGVSRSAHALGWELEMRQCEVRIAEWEGQDGRCKGVDDLIANEGSGAGEAALDNAVPFVEWRQLWQVRNRLKRPSDVHIGDDEFSDHVDKIPRTGLVVLNGRKATGKTGAMEQLIAGRTALSITATRSLAHSQVERFGGVFLQNADIANGRLLVDGGVAQVVTGCVASVERLARVPHQVLILDEVTEMLDFHFKCRLSSRDGRRADRNDALVSCIREAEQIIIGDADLTGEALQFIEVIRGEKAFVVTTDRKPLTYGAFFLKSEEELLGAVKECLVNQPDKLVPIHCDTKAQAEKLATHFERMGYSALLITADTTGEELQRRFLVSHGQDIPDLLARGIRIVLVSPVIQTGFNITYNTDRAAAVFMTCRGTSITPEGVVQTLDRWRCDTDRFIFAPRHGRAYSRFSRATNEKTFLKDMKAMSAASLRLVAPALTIDAFTKATGIDWDSPELRYFAHSEVNRNRGMNTFAARIKALLRYDGKRPHDVPAVLSKEEVRAIRESLKEAAEANEMQRHTRLMGVTTPTPEKVERLQRKDTLTPDEKLEVERYWVEQFYRVELSLSLLEFDRKGRTRQEIRRLEELLVDGVALERTVRSIEENPDTPQDWVKSEVRRQLMEKAGGNAYIKAIIRGEVTELKSEDYTPILDYIRTHPHEYELAFGFKRSGLKNMGDRQLLGMLLAWYGLKTKRHGVRVPGTGSKGKKSQFVYSYYVDREHLGLLLTVLQRRNPGVSPLFIADDYQKGETSSDPAFTGVSGSGEPLRDNLSQGGTPSTEEVTLLFDQKALSTPIDRLAG